MKIDKIFNNNYGTNDLNEAPISFNLESHEFSVDQLGDTHYNLLMDRIDELIKGSKFEHLNETTESEILKKLNKVQINEIFIYVLENVGEDYTKVDLFNTISDYFDILPSKFYNSLSNKFKDQLIKELDDKYNILEKKKIRRLF